MCIAIPRYSKNVKEKQSIQTDKNFLTSLNTVQNKVFIESSCIH